MGKEIGKMYVSLLTASRFGIKIEDSNTQFDMEPDRHSHTQEE